MMKTCSKCEKELSVKEFRKNKNKKDGLQAYCITCQAECSKASYERNKDKVKARSKKRQIEFRLWWKEYKQQFRCECGQNHPACLDFHHPDENKEAAVSDLIRYQNKERLLAEVAKCVPICRNCHAILHWQSADELQEQGVG